MKEIQAASNDLPSDIEISSGILIIFFYHYLLDIEEKKRRRLIYLTQQSEVYSLYMQGVRTINSKAVNPEKKSQGRQRAGRMTEEEEDKQLLTTSTDDRGFTRLTSQV